MFIPTASVLSLFSPIIWFPSRLTTAIRRLHKCALLLAVIGVWANGTHPVLAQEPSSTGQERLLSEPRLEDSSPQAPHVPSRQAAQPGYDLIVGVREWISQGRSAHNIGNPFGPPNVSSELSWRGLNVPITQFSGDLIVQDRLIADLEVGYGSRGHGTLRDEDWDGNNRTQKFSDTLSEVSGGSVLTVSATTGLRALSWRVRDNPVPGGLDLLVGYQYWRERYEASGIQNLLTGTSSLAGVRAITQTNTWNSIRIGTRVTVPLLSRLAVKGSVFYIPYTAHQNEDIHHLRSDLRKDPSFLTTATGGNGIQLEGSATVRLWRRLTLEAGYAYWDIRSGRGTVEAFDADGSIGLAQHNVENTRRQGVFFGANWIF